MARIFRISSARPTKIFSARAVFPADFFGDAFLGAGFFADFAITPIIS
jgi:hypothetical protein